MKNGLIVLVAKEKYFTMLFEINKVPVYQKECVKHLDACQDLCKSQMGYSHGLGMNFNQ